MLWIITYGVSPFYSACFMVLTSVIVLARVIVLGRVMLLSRVMDHNLKPKGPSTSSVDLNQLIIQIFKQ